ncbi:arylesterase [Shinella sp. M27]|uniref:arylesterase n=1 Tax=Shinella sp. M27 TaxID=3368614 RepID=UPI003BA227D5
MSFKAALGFFISLAITALLSAGSAFAEPIKLVGFGDSLMAGYQLPASDAFPVKLEAALKAKGYDVEIANAGVSGDTSSSGLARLDWSVPDGTKGVILELGANDALRGIAPEETEKNLDAMLTRLKERGIAVLLAGMLAPPNMGADYEKRFNGIYQRMAEKHGVALYPFFLDGVAAQADLQIDDGMHPNPAGVDVMVAKILPTAEAFLKAVTAGE